MAGFMKNAMSYLGMSDVVDDDDVLAGQGGSQELMGYDGVLAIYDGGVVSSFIEHTQVDTQDVGEVYRTLHGALIRGDDH